MVDGVEGIAGGEDESLELGTVEVGFDEIGMRDESAPWLGDALESAKRLDRQSQQYVYDEFTRQV